jgi:hypothetical protein
MQATATTGDIAWQPRECPDGELRLAPDSARLHVFGGCRPSVFNNVSSSKFFQNTGRLGTLFYKLRDAGPHRHLNCLSSHWEVPFQAARKQGHTSLAHAACTAGAVLVPSAQEALSVLVCASLVGQPAVSANIMDRKTPARHLNQPNLFR